MPKDTKTLGNNKARACESLGFVHKKGCARVLTHLRSHIRILNLLENINSSRLHSIRKMELKQEFTIKCGVDLSSCRGKFIFVSAYRIFIL